MGNPLQGLDIPDTVTEKIHYTGYLPRSLPEKSHSQYLAEMEEPYLLVTPGGGGDGVEMVDWVLRAYERCSDLPWRALFILGPFMAVADQERFRERAAVLERVSLITFDNHIESLMDHAAGVVAMGGYNTFCEILSFNKRALVIPRTTPREEQLIRARNALKLGLIQVLEPEHLEDTDKMVQAIKALQHRPLPANLVPPHFMDGLRTLNKRFYEIIAATTKNPPR
jgi:predicted glycosyltransferase